MRSRRRRGRPILIDKFLESAVEVDVDCLSDGSRVVIGGVMQHIEEAGIHSGDSACVIPPHSLPARRRSRRSSGSRSQLTGALECQGLDEHPVRGRRTPTTCELREIYISKPTRGQPHGAVRLQGTGVPLARLAALVMVGKTLDELGVKDEVVPTHYSVKESVFPFNKFPGVDIILGPEMRSTGEVMGIDDHFPMAFAKAQMAANSPLPASGTIFISVADRDKAEIVPIARQFAEMGYTLLSRHAAPRRRFAMAGVPVTEMPKIQEGRPNLLDA